MDKKIESLHGLLKKYIQEFDASQFVDKKALAKVCIIGRKLGQFDLTATKFLQFAASAFNRKSFEECIEAMFKGLLNDISYGKMLISGNPKRSYDIGRAYEHISKYYSLPMVKSNTTNQKTKIAHLVTSVSDVTAPGKILNSFIFYYDSLKYDVFIYSCELQGKHKDIVYHPFKKLNPSTISGKQTIKLAGQKNIPITLAPTGETYLKCAVALGKRIAKDNIDVLIVHANPANAMAGIIAGLKPAKYMINFDHGVPIVMNKFDLIVHHLEDSYKKWRTALMDFKIKNEYIPISSAIETAPISQNKREEMRETLGIKNNDVVLIKVSFRLQVMMSNAFIETISQCLLQNPYVHFVIVGGGGTDYQKDFFKAQGLSERAHFIGTTKDVASYLDMADIYVNTFPLGGGVSVIEAMAHGLSVVTARCGDSQTEKAGAEHVEYDELIAGDSKERYLEILNRLCKNPDYRKMWGDRLKIRHRENFLPEVMVKRWENLIERLLSGTLSDGQGEITV